MQIVIDIPKKLKQKIDEGFTNQVITYKLWDATKNGTPLPTGHWILTDDDFVYCSECEDSYYPRPIDASWYYCPHCGAKMVEPQEGANE